MKNEEIIHVESNLGSSLLVTFMTCFWQKCCMLEQHEECSTPCVWRWHHLPSISWTCVLRCFSNRRDRFSLSHWHFLLTRWWLTHISDIWLGIGISAITTSREKQIACLGIWTFALASLGRCANQLGWPQACNYKTAWIKPGLGPGNLTFEYIH